MARYWAIVGAGAAAGMGSGTGGEEAAVIELHGMLGQAPMRQPISH